MTSEETLNEAVKCYCEKRQQGVSHEAAVQTAYLVMTNYPRGTISRDGWERLTEAINSFGEAVAIGTANGTTRIVELISERVAEGRRLTCPGS